MGETEGCTTCDFARNADGVCLECRVVNTYVVVGTAVVSVAQPAKTFLSTGPATNNGAKIVRQKSSSIIM